MFINNQNPCLFFDMKQSPRVSYTSFLPTLDIKMLSFQPCLSITLMPLSNILFSISSPIYHLPLITCLSFPLPPARCQRSLQAGAYKAFSKSLSNDLWDLDALLQHQLMEGMQLTSTLAPGRLERVRARAIVCACVRAFGSNRLHIMGLQWLRKHPVIRLQMRNMWLLIWLLPKKTFTNGKSILIAHHFWVSEWIVSANVDLIK